MFNKLFMKCYEWYVCPAEYELSDVEDDVTVCRLRRNHKGNHRSIYGWEWTTK